MQLFFESDKLNRLKSVRWSWRAVVVLVTQVVLSLSISSQVWALEMTAPVGTVNVNSIQVLQPVAGEVWQRGKSYTIAWQNTDVASASLAHLFLETVRGPDNSICDFVLSIVCPFEVKSWVIATNQPASGSLLWQVPSDLPSQFLGDARVVARFAGSADNSGSSGVIKLQAVLLATPVSQGYVDAVSRIGGQTSGWVYSSTSAAAPKIILQYRQFQGSGVYTQEVAPTLARPDADAWLKRQYGNELPLKFPLGFTADPAGVIASPGIYMLTGARLADTNTPLVLSGLATAPFIIGSVSSQPLTISVDSNIEGGTITVKVGQPLHVRLFAAGGVGVGYTWKTSDDGPAGLRWETGGCTDGVACNPEASFVLAGEPTEDGVFSLNVSVVDAAGNSASKNFVLKIEPAPIRDMTISSPGSGATWYRGQMKAIRWSPAQVGTSIKISLVSYQVCPLSTQDVCPKIKSAPRLIASSVPNTGVYNWNIPADYPILGEAFIVLDNTVTGKSVESYNFFLSDKPVCAGLKPGQLVSSGNGTVYIITEACEKYGFVSYQDFVSRGYKFNQVQKVSVQLLSGLPAARTLALGEGSSFRYLGKSAIYFLSAEGCKQIYPSPVTLRVWGVALDLIMTVPDGEQYKDCNRKFVRLPDNSLVRLASSKIVYLLRAGSRYPLASVTAATRLGLNLKNTLVVPSGELGLYKLAEPLE